MFPLVKLQRILSTVLLGTALTISPLMGAQAAGPKAGNQCKKKEVGKTTAAGLVCQQQGSKFVWVRVPPTASNGCDPNYEPCVPIDSDVDCAGGSGNGPSYVQGPIKVIGVDIYDLDRDGDGIGCEKK
jgi:hypothetical protein